MRRNKILPKVGFVLIVAISLSFFIQKTISAAINTATWKLYQNREYGFQIHIPEDWELTGRPILTMFLFGERGTGHREAIAVSVSSVSEETGDIEKIKEDPALTTSQKIVDGYEMFCYENATPEEDSTALVKDGYKTMGCFFREGIMSYSIGFVVNYKVREKINVFNAMVDSFKLIDKMNHSELERI